MTRCKHILILVLLLIYGVCIAEQSDEDWEYLNTITLKYKATERTSISLKSDQKFIDDLNVFSEYNGIIGIQYDFTDHFVLGAEYKHIKGKKDDGWALEHRYTLAPTIKWNVADTKWSLRTKIEYRDVEDHGYWRVRERLKIKMPTQIGDIEFTPFISTELLYNSKANRLTRNRVQVGVGKKFGDQLELVLYYRNEASDIEGSNDYKYKNRIGTEIVFNF